MYRVAKFALTIGVVDKLGIKKIKRVVCKKGLGGRPQRTKTSADEDGQNVGLLLPSMLPLPSTSS